MSSQHRYPGEFGAEAAATVHPSRHEVVLQYHDVMSAVAPAKPGVLPRPAVAFPPDGHQPPEPAPRYVLLFRAGHGSSRFPVGELVVLPFLLVEGDPRVGVAVEVAGDEPVALGLLDDADDVAEFLCLLLVALIHCLLWLLVRRGVSPRARIFRGRRP